MSDMFKVSSSGLNLRSTPVVDPTNVLVVLSKGQVVTKLAKSPGNDFWEVSTIVDGKTFQGFVSSRFLSALGETLAEIVASGKTLTFNELGDKVELVAEIQKKLRNLGLYFGGPWINEDLGDQSTGRTWKELQKFSTLVSLNLPSTSDAMNPSLAKALLETQQIPSILDDARNTDQILQKLKSIQPGIGVPASGGNGPAVAFLNRTIRNSPFEQVVKSYPANLAQQVDGTSLVSYGKTFQLTGSGTTVTFTDYPAKGFLPSIDGNGLDFLDSSIEHACVCVGSFIAGDDEIKTHWLGRNHLEEQQFLSSTKFIGVLNTISQLNAMHPNCDVDNCDIISGGGRRNSFSALVEDIVTYAEKIASSNSIAAMFKRFSTRKGLEDWTRGITGNQGLSFRGYYGPEFPPLISSPIIFDTTPGSSQNVLRSAPEIGSGPNLISAYDLVRLISMMGWHLHLPAGAQLPGAQWNSLESVVRAMGLDIGRYIDVALETLGLINVVNNKPVIISKAGWGDSGFTYVALVKLVDNRQSPAKLRTLAMALRTSDGSEKKRDSNMATAVTEIMRRIFTEELA